jgi:hypothetical protein
MGDYNSGNTLRTPSETVAPLPQPATKPATKPVIVPAPVQPSTPSCILNCKSLYPNIKDYYNEIDKKNNNFTLQELNTVSENECDALINYDSKYEKRRFTLLNDSIGEPCTWKVTSMGDYNSGNTLRTPSETVVPLPEPQPATKPVIVPAPVQPSTPSCILNCESFYPNIKDYYYNKDKKNSDFNLIESKKVSENECDVLFNYDSKYDKRRFTLLNDSREPCTWKVTSMGDYNSGNTLLSPSDTAPATVVPLP